MISFSRGRPRAIHLSDSDIDRPQLQDFPNEPLVGERFIAYVDICCILGDIVELRSKSQLSPAKALDIENALFRWSHTLPSHLHLAERSSSRPDDLELRPHDFRARQPHVIYFVCVAILARSQASPRELSPCAFLAASYAAGIYEDFLARDLVRILAPTFTSFAFVSSLELLSLRPHASLWTSTMPDLQVLQASLDELAHRWKSAIGASKAINKALESFQDRPAAASHMPRSLTPAEESLFDGYPTALCKLRIPFSSETDRIGSFEANPGPTPMNGNAMSDTPQFPLVNTFIDTLGLGEDWVSAASYFDSSDSNFWKDWDFGR